MPLLVCGASAASACCSAGEAVLCRALSAHHSVFFFFFSIITAHTVEPTPTNEASKHASQYYFLKRETLPSVFIETAKGLTEKKKADFNKCILRFIRSD